MSGHETDSSDDDWVISSTIPDESKPKTPALRQTKPTISQAAIRTIHASIPKSQLLPPQKPPPAATLTNSTTTTTTSKVRQAAVPDYLSSEELDKICRTMNGKMLMERLVGTYRNAETFIKIREIETPELSIDTRLCEHLHDCPDPGMLIVNFLSHLATYFVENEPDKKDETRKFCRYLAKAACHAYRIFLTTPPTKYKVPKMEEYEKQEQDLISFTEEVSEPNLISFDDEPEPAGLPSQVNGTTGQNGVNNHSEEEEDEVDDDDDESDVDTSDDDDLNDGIATISLVELLHIPPDVASRYTLSRRHQLAMIDLLETTPAPILIYYAMDVFKLESLLKKDGECVENGIQLCKSLLARKNYNEAVSCIRKLQLFDAFPIRQLAQQLLVAGQGGVLPVLVSGHEHLQRELLHYIDVQLRYTFAGSLGVVRQELLKSIAEDEKTMPPLPRLKERKFQKELSSYGNKILLELQLPEREYYFIWLSQRYACLRWLITQRALQQMEEGYPSIEATSNFNGLIDLVAGDDPALAKLAIKEFVDIGDPIAPPHFAARLGQQQFFTQYYSRPLQERMVGVIKGEQLSRIPIPPPGRHSPMAPPPRYYTIPHNVLPVMVDNQEQLMQMQFTLAQCRICGLDTEWVPQFARSTSRTALMQIACDCDVVFLLDLKAALDPSNIGFLHMIDRALRQLFEASHITKLAYDFGGDLAMLRECMPTAKEWKTESFVDYKNLKTAAGQPVAGGLSGLVSTFLKFTMNKKQQLSNWEQRPLTDEQIRYAAGDAYCLLEIYSTLVSMDHPFVKSLPPINKHSYQSRFSPYATGARVYTP